MKTRKLTVMALTTAIALILSFIESQIPAFVAVPGVKMGLANIAIVYALYRLGWKEAAMVSLVRVVLVSMLFGSMASFLYSLAGAVLSLLGMTLLKKTGKFTEIIVSVAGGVLHNVGQIGMACLILETDVLRYYLPFLLVSGILAGKPMDRTYEREYKEMLREFTGPYGMPVVCNINIGHSQPRCIIPFGREAVVDAAGQTIRFAPR